jgi:ATP-binding cassette subfamily B protein
MRNRSKISEDRPLTRDLRPLARLLGFLWPYRLRVLAAVLGLMVAAGAALAFGQVFRNVVDSGLGSGSAAALNRALGLFLAVVVVFAGTVVLRSFLLNWLGERVVADIRQAVFERVLGLDVGFFETTRTGEVISRLTSDTALLQVVVGSTLAMALRNLLLVAGGVVMLAVTSLKLTGLVLLGTPAVVLPVWLLGYRVRRLARQSQDRIADVGAYVDEVLHAIRTVQAFCHEPVDRRRYGDRVEAAFATAIRRALLGALLAGLVIFLTFGAIGVVLWTGGHEVIADRLSGGELSAFVFYAVLVARSVGGLSEVLGELLRGAGASERLLELLEQRPRIAAPARPRRLPSPAAGGIEIRGLRFAYLGERGVRLSGGQRQRIAIARAVLRGPPLLLLDEATSALDAESERLVQEALERLMEGRTSIVIAHRLATVRKVDRIMVIDQGRVVASGTHEALMAEGGLYARLAALQFRDLAEGFSESRIAPPRQAAG